MFFPRLRRQAKWMFVFLALVFGVGFVAFGVGGNLPGTGLGDLFRGAGATTGQVSESEAREKIEENPNNATAYKELADALLRDQKIDQAIPPLERYTRMRPNDEDALQQLVGLYVSRAETLQAEVAAAQEQLGEANAGALFAPGLTDQNGQPVRRDPVSESLGARANERFNNAYTKMQAAYSKATRAYKRLAKLSPDDPRLQFELARTADAGGDTKTAIAAYRRFVRLSPDDPNAPLVKERIKQLQASANQGSLQPAGG